MGQTDLLPHQSLCHGGLILPGQVLLQRQDHAVGSDGGQDHVLKRCKGQKFKESSFNTELSKLLTIIYLSILKCLFKITEKLHVVLCKQNHVE